MVPSNEIPSSAPPPDKRKPNKLLRIIVVLFVVLVGLLLILVQAFASTSYSSRVEGDAMLPTLHTEDRLQVNRAIYNLQKPQRGDIVVFTPPIENKDFIKRVVALEGETIEIKADIDLAGTLDQDCGGCGAYVNGIKLDEQYVKQTPDYDYGPITVEKDQIFVLGDNRRNSSDSHIFGPVDVSAIKGKAIFKYGREFQFLETPIYP